jgi:predicted molibdopterin-dependent oxidoreductase YjgC
MLRDAGRVIIKTLPNWSSPNNNLAVCLKEKFAFV